MNMQKIVTDLVVSWIRRDSPDIYNEIMGECESLVIRAALIECKYNQSKTARVLGVSRGNLRTKLKKYFGSEFL